MRASQPYGLTQEAYDFLKEHARLANHCTACNRSNGYISVGTNITYGMFDELRLVAYSLKEGGAATEEVQFTSWSSGEMSWLRLVTPNKTFEWTDKEINEPCGEKVSVERSREGDVDEL